MTVGPRAAIVGIAGPSLTFDERRLLERLPPAGVILFARNCVDRGQLAALVADIGALTPGRRTPVLIDQEGGRVMRLRPPHWRPLPAAGVVGALPAADGLRAAWLLGRLIAHDLAEVGISIACAPVTDLAWPGATAAIGARAFAADPWRAARLATACARGLIAGGVAPVIKHLPGHGRATVDSHEALPVVEAGLDELADTDLVPSRAMVSAVGLAMTAHVVYRAIDPHRPGTLSPTVIAEVIRGRIGFRGILLSDDLAMGALTGPVAERAGAALAAGCDLAMHCTGRIEEGRAVLEAVPEAAVDLAAAVPPPSVDGFDAAAGDLELRELWAVPVA